MKINNIDFNKKIKENILNSKKPYVVAHRGVSGANIPCNTLASFKIALDQKAEVIELDVSKSKDGVYFVFHPGKEQTFLKCDKSISEMDSNEVKELFLVNQDDVKTKYKIPTLEEAFNFLKDKCYINVDKFWTDIEGISNMIRKCHVEKQVIVKTFAKKEYIDSVEKYASDFNYMVFVYHKDEVSDILEKRNLNYIGTEVIFNSDDDEVSTKEYVDKMHQKGLLVWANAIVYDDNDIINANHSDDTSLILDVDQGWGHLVKQGYDFIQTDYTLPLNIYLESIK